MQGAEHSAANPAFIARAVRCSPWHRVLAAAFLFFIVTATTAVAAHPWVEPGNPILRHDLQLLADAGIVRAPLTAWPLSWADITRDTLNPDLATGHRPEVLQALSRVQDRARRQVRAGATAHLRLAAAGDAPPLRTFSDIPREQAEAGAGVSWMGGRFALRLQGTYVRDPSDDKQVRTDGSYLGIVLGNWMLAAGSMDRWWGPGWEGSNILSTNARPVPGVSLQRGTSQPFESRWLKWIGHWNLTFFAGQLENERDVAQAKLIGARFTFKPVSSLEIGLSRTAQWGGEGRPEDWSSFWNLLIGRDNTGDDGINFGNEPGNQLAGVDLRWSFPAVRAAIYVQHIGEDEDRYLPTSFIEILGVETWGALGTGSSYRLRLERAITTAAFNGQAPRLNYAYNHHTYTDGYRYYDRSLGHAIDNDGRTYALGALLVTRAGHGWELLLRRVELNRDGAGLNTVSADARTVDSAEFAARFNFRPHALALGVSTARTTVEASGLTETGRSAFAEWRMDF